MKRMMALPLLPTLLLAYGAGATEISGNVSYTSDYLYDGLSQTGNDAALQAGLNIVDDSGIYFSAWASQIDFGDVCGDNADESCHASVETDWFLGFSGGDDALNYDIGFAHYQYFAGGDGFDYSEVYAAITLNGTKFGAWHSRDFAGTGVMTNRFKVSYEFPINDDWSFPFEIGHDRFSEVFDFGGAIDKSYNYCRIALGYRHKNWYAEMAYVRTDLDAQPAADKDMLSIDGNLVFGITYSFDSAP